MKKIIAMLLALVMALSLVACGGGNDAPATTAPAANNNNDTPATEGATVEDVSLKVWAPGDEMEITRQMVDAFAAAHPEYNLNVEILDLGIDQCDKVLRNDPDAGADVFQLPSGGIPAMIEEGLILPITVDVDAVKALYGEGALASCIAYNEALDMDLLYAIPFSPNTWFIYYNTDMFTAEEVKSLDTMLAKDLGEGIQNFSCDITNSWYIEAFFYGAGCNLYGAYGNNPDECDWNSDKGLAAVEYMINMVNNPNYLEEADSISFNMLKEGKLGAVCSGTWSYPDLYAALGDKLGAAALPTAEIGGEVCQLQNFADYKTWAVKSNTAHPIAAQQLAAWLANEESQLLRYTEAGAAPTVLSLLDAPEVAATVSVVAIIDQPNYSVPQPSIPKINDYWTPATALGEGIVNGTITMDNAQAELDKLVNNITGDLLG